MVGRDSQVCVHIAADDAISLRHVQSGNPCEASPGHLRVCHTRLEDACSRWRHHLRSLHLALSLLLHEASPSALPFQRPVPHLRQVVSSSHAHAEWSAKLKSRNGATSPSKRLFTLATAPRRSPASSLVSTTSRATLTRPLPGVVVAARVSRRFVERPHRQTREGHLLSRYHRQRDHQQRAQGEGRGRRRALHALPHDGRLEDRVLLGVGMRSALDVDITCRRVAC